MCNKRRLSCRDSRHKLTKKFHSRYGSANFELQLCKFQTLKHRKKLPNGEEVLLMVIEKSLRYLHLQKSQNTEFTFCDYNLDFHMFVLKRLLFIIWEGNSCIFCLPLEFSLSFVIVGFSSVPFSLQLVILTKHYISFF